MTNRTKLVFITLLMAMSTPQLLAQQRFLLEDTTAKEGQSEPFEAGQKDYCAAVVRGGAPSCQVFSQTTFSPPRRYLTLLEFSSFDHYDGGTYTSKGLTPSQAKELSSRRSPAISSNTEYAVELEPSVSYPASNSPGLALVTEFEIESGTSNALLQYIRNVELPMARNSGFASFELYRTVLGGNTNHFLLIRRFKTYRQLDQIKPFGDLARAKQRPADELNALSINSIRVTVMKVRADLSGRK